MSSLCQWKVSFVVNKTILELHNKTALHLIWSNPSHLNPWDPTLIWKDVIYAPVKAEIFTVAAKLTALAHYQYEVGVNVDKSF